MRLALVILLGLLTACKDEKSVTINMAMGKKIKSFINDSSITMTEDCMDKLSLCFYRFKKPFSSTALPSVDLTVDGSIVRVTHVVGMNIIEDKLHNEGYLEDVELTLRGVPSHSEIAVTKQFSYALIQNFLDAGWRRYIHLSDPRISGSESMKFEACSDKMLDTYIMSDPCFDPNYEMSDEQWRKVKGFYRWHFYKNGYYMKLEAWSSRGEKDLEGQASYLFTIALKSEQEFWLESFKEKDMPRWKQLLPNLLEKYRDRREDIESKLEDFGIKIDRLYEDPPISALGDKTSELTHLGRAND